MEVGTQITEKGLKFFDICHHNLLLKPFSNICQRCITTQKVCKKEQTNILCFSWFAIEIFVGIGVRYFVSNYYLVTHTLLNALVHHGEFHIWTDDHEARDSHQIRFDKTSGQVLTLKEIFTSDSSKYFKIVPMQVFQFWPAMVVMPPASTALAQASYPDSRPGRNSRNTVDPDIKAWFVFIVIIIVIVVVFVIVSRLEAWQELQEHRWPGEKKTWFVFIVIILCLLLFLLLYRDSRSGRNSRKTVDRDIKAWFVSKM